MKVIEKHIPTFELDNFFTPIRDKSSYVRVLILGARLLLLNFDNIKTTNTLKMKLVIDKMSRLFFYMDKKYFSISFPFTVELDDKSVISIYSYSGKEVNNKSISEIICILDSEDFKLNRSLIDFYIESTSIDFESIYLLEEIFMFEPSYIRYDYDAENENEKLHPLHHLDLNYSQHSTFKIGLHTIINEHYFEDIQNIKTDCLFMHD